MTTNAKVMWANDPPHLKEMFKLLGLSEIAGPRHEPKVLALYRDAGHSEIHDDETAWCAACVGACLVRAGHPTSQPASQNLMARSYMKYGTACDLKKRVPRGAIIVWPRGAPPSGHVNVCLDDDGEYLTCIGGNQGNGKGGGVTISRESKAHAIAARMPLGVVVAPLSKPKPMPQELPADVEESEQAPEPVAVKPNPPLADDERVPFFKRWWKTISGYAGGGTVGLGAFAYATDWKVVLAIFAGSVLTVASLVGLVCLLMGPTNVRNFIRRQINKG